MLTSSAGSVIAVGVNALTVTRKQEEELFSCFRAVGLQWSWGNGQSPVKTLTRATTPKTNLTEKMRKTPKKDSQCHLFRGVICMIQYTQTLHLHIQTFLYIYVCTYVYKGASALKNSTVLNLHCEREREAGCSCLLPLPVYITAFSCVQSAFYVCLQQHLSATRMYEDAGTPAMHLPLCRISSADILQSSTNMDCTAKCPTPNNY